MFKKMKSMFESAFQQLSDAQREIDDSARKVVEGVQRMIDGAENEAPSSREALAGHDFSWYEETARTLSGEGFGASEGFEPETWLTRPIASRTLSEYAAGDAGTVVANWFALPARGTQPENRAVTLASVSEDGHHFDTTQNSGLSALPLPPTMHVDHVESELSLPDMLKRHRASIARHGVPMRAFADVAFFLVERNQRAERTARFRREQGGALVERYIEARFQGDRQEVGAAFIASFRAHPEWYAYSDAKSAAPQDAPWPADAPELAPSMPLNFLMSQTDEGRCTITSFGMLFAGLPELLLRDVAANHSRAGRFLLATVAHAIARHRAELGSDAAFLAALVSVAGARLTLTTADAPPTEDTRQATGPVAPATIDVHVSLRGFAPDDEPSLLSINPLPDGSGPLDERVRAACSQLGCGDVPLARSADTFDAAMQEAQERARARLPEVRSRFQAGLGPDEHLCVKIRAVEGDIGEYVWLQVHAWQGGELTTEVVTPAPRVRLAAGAPLTIVEERIFDQFIAGPHGIVLPSTTDRVAEDYGRDV